MNIYVGNLSYNVTDNSLRELFEKYGEVVSARVMMDKETGKSRGFAFVEMADEEGGQRVIDELNGQDVSGRAIRISKALPREQRPRSPRPNRY